MISVYVCFVTNITGINMIYIYTYMYMDSVAYVNQLYLNNIGKYVSLSYMTVPYLVSTYIYIYIALSI